MSKEFELKPCPFCGAAGIVERSTVCGMVKGPMGETYTRHAVRAILSAIDQPQEDVCEWDFKGRLYGGGPWYGTKCNHAATHRQTWSGDCPYCGKPIKVKE